MADFLCLWLNGGIGLSVVVMSLVVAAGVNLPTSRRDGTRQSVRSFPRTRAWQRRHRIGVLPALRGWVRDRDGVAAFCRDRSRTGPRQTRNVRLTGAQKSGWRCRSDCWGCDSRGRRLRFAFSHAVGSRTSRSIRSQLFLLELLINLPRAEIDALDKQCAAQQIESETDDH